MGCTKSKTEDPFPWRLFLISIAICGAGSFHFGFQLTVVNPTERVFRGFINRTAADHYGTFMSEETYRLIWSAILNLQFVGSLFGTLPLVKLSETLGRRKTFYVSSGVVGLGLVLQAVSKIAGSFEVFAVGRLATGFGSGLALALEPMYLNEISPVERRGFIGSMTGIFVELGFVAGGIIALPVLLGTSEFWPYIFVVEMAPVVLLLVVLRFIPESPKFLLAKGKPDECRRASMALGHRDLVASMKEIAHELETQTSQVTYKEIWTKTHLRKACILGTLVTLTAITSGIIAIDFFSTSIFMEVGLSEFEAQYASVGTFLISFFAAIVGGFITDRVGRRVLLLITTVGLILLDIGLMAFSIVHNVYGVKWAGYLSVTACVLFTFTFGIGPVVLQWTITSEMVPQNARSKVQAIAMTVQKVAGIMVGIAFYPLQGLVGAYSFLLFIIPLLIYLIVFIFQFPETKNKTIVEIMGSLGYKEANEKEKSNISAIAF